MLGFLSSITLPIALGISRPEGESIKSKVLRGKPPPLGGFTLGGCHVHSQDRHPKLCYSLHRNLEVPSMAGMF